MQPHTKEYESYLIKLAEDNIDKGVIEEPRLYYETIPVSNVITDADANTFVNGEQFPVRIQYITAAIVAPDAETLIQRVGMRLRFHDSFYMNDQFVPLPNWGTKVVASSDVINSGTSSQKFTQPVVLSARDSLQVTVQLAVQPDDEVIPVSVTLTGVGILSKRPYFLSGRALLADMVSTILPGEGFRNEGSEPILLTDCTVSIEGALGTNNTPNARDVFVGIKQIGNGTNANWVVTGTGLDVPNGALGACWGTYSGRAIVHEFPGQGLIWEPGEGILVSTQNTTLDPQLTFNLGLCLVGYIAIQ